MNKMFLIFKEKKFTVFVFYEHADMKLIKKYKVELRLL